ncbi:MAG: hypothetical protein KBC43_11910 [Bacteroidales bacterium]|nr:hypothetical protein [Bacteroidales bacterium]
MTEVIPNPSYRNRFEVVHRYTTFVPELNYFVRDGEIYKVVTLEVREVERRSKISFGIAGSKIESIFIDIKKEKRRRIN